ncbi:hypothetical protein EYR38_001667 [Pleurotus pulmonarius]|nr:hypothetical protein EYR38_001667 [Pleurotus pulmonarius]
MSSNRPPQLHLALPTSTTSFKRSFEQFGFDLESPLSQAEPGSSSSSGTLGSSGDGHERSKRPRSESSLSGVADSSSASSQASESGNSSDGTLTSGSEVEAPSIPADPPRLPTPELEDVEMAYYLPTEDSNAPPQPHPRTHPNTTSNTEPS